MEALSIPRTAVVQAARMRLSAGRSGSLRATRRISKRRRLENNSGLRAVKEFFANDLVTGNGINGNLFEVTPFAGGLHDPVVRKDYGETLRAEERAGHCG